MDDTTKQDAVRAGFHEALARLAEAVRDAVDDLDRDGAIQRFEFTLDLAWKALKTVLEERYGVVCRSPKGCLRDAYQQGIIAYDAAWQELVDLRNLTAHTYNRTTADRVFRALPRAVELFEQLDAMLGK